MDGSIVRMRGRWETCPWGLLLLLVAVEILVLGVVLAGLGEFFRLGLLVHVAGCAGLLGCLGVLGLPVGGSGADQKTAQQNDSGQCNFQMGHDASNRQRSNSRANC